jgi:chaperone modulatory protein CbpM
MLDQPELARELRVDTKRLQSFIDRGWISPPVLEGRTVLRDVDLARAALIADLADSMGLNDEGVDLVLDLLDQLYSLRSVFGNLIDALEVQPFGVRRHLVNDARKLSTLTRLRSRALR